MSGSSILAIVCAIGSFFVGAGFGLLLAIIAIIAGVLGLVLSLSPSVRGGVTSFFAIIAGLVGIVAAVVKLIVAIAS
jgi:hypothetical protein